MSQSGNYFCKISVKTVVSGLALSFLFLTGCTHDYALFREGRDLYALQEYDKAREKFETLRKDYPKSNILELSDEYLRLTRESLRKKETPPEGTLPAVAPQKAGGKPEPTEQKVEQKPEKL
ncbi:MAG: tetratricopeptide repeat protein, partial [Thermodesulfovibrionales bacterium]